MCGQEWELFPALSDEVMRKVDLHEYIIPTRCLPALGIHENCEHVKTPPTFPRADR